MISTNGPRQITALGGTATFERAPLDLVGRSSFSGRLAALAAAAGLFAVNLDLDTVNLPSSLPLSSITWLMIGASWLVSLVVFPWPRQWTSATAGWWFLAFFALR